MNAREPVENHGRCALAEVEAHLFFAGQMAEVHALQLRRLLEVPFKGVALGQAGIVHSLPPPPPLAMSNTVQWLQH
jgi:hypothetical protein